MLRAEAEKVIRAAILWRRDRLEKREGRGFSGAEPPSVEALEAAVDTFTAAAVDAALTPPMPEPIPLAGPRAGVTVG